MENDMLQKDPILKTVWELLATCKIKHGSK